MNSKGESQPIDAAALGASALAGALAVFIEPGPFDEMSLVTGGTLLLITGAYQLNRARTFVESVAFAATVAFLMLLPVGFILEMYFSLGTPLGICNKSSGCELDELASSVSPRVLATCWLLGLLPVALLDQWNQRRKF